MTNPMTVHGIEITEAQTQAAVGGSAGVIKRHLLAVDPGQAKGRLKCNFRRLLSAALLLPFSGLLMAAPKPEAAHPLVLAALDCRPVAASKLAPLLQAVSQARTIKVSAGDASRITLMTLNGQVSAEYDVAASLAQVRDRLKISEPIVGLAPSSEVSSFRDGIVIHLTMKSPTVSHVFCQSQ